MVQSFFFVSFYLFPAPDKIHVLEQALDFAGENRAEPEKVWSIMKITPKTQHLTYMQTTRNQSFTQNMFLNIPQFPFI